MAETPKKPRRFLRGCLIAVGVLVVLSVIGQMIGGGTTTPQTAAPTAAVAPTTAPAGAAAVPAPTDVPAPTEAPAPTLPPTDIPAPTEAPLPTETPIPPAPITFEGQAQDVTEPTEIPKGLYRAKLSHNGQSNFQVQTFAPDGAETYMTNVIGVYEGIELLQSDGGAWTFEVNADGPWTIVLEPMSAEPDAADGIEGKGDYVTGLFEPSQEGNVPYTFTHDGESNFQVQLICAGGGDYLQNEIGPVENTAMARFGNGPCLWDVNADGNWTIAPR